MKLLDLLVLELSRLPGLGRRSALRIAFHLLEREDIDGFLNLIREAKSRIHPCKECFNLTEDDLCGICSNPRRNERQLCVVERVQDLWALENSQTYQGRYFVLGGVLSPAKHIGPDRLPFDQLWNKFKENNVQELILALNTGVESDATAGFIRTQVLRSSPHVKISHIARGIPAGGELEFLDRETIAQAFEERRTLL